ncbi:MAG: ATP-dependent helicase [Candidatus Latescibacteria bacterium]|jgi:DNA helicase-2/ATP-dependent DNA helicase PcrA|nr:ATP-dependent helicase [Candidatus Latescibacterota bacterium]MDP7449530.1 ATP-dependent helicase [Candidatus Latescibacterota bacterium]HJP32743.1 ATP-dependent helicase [Candidatus Latescibacterota bacterium]
MTVAPGADFEPRPGQREILAYEAGWMGVAAVPGSGKTTTIAALAARLLDGRFQGEGPLGDSGEVLVVTYQNTAAESLRSRIGRQLSRQGLPPSGYAVRTLHGLAYSIVQMWPGHAGTTSDFRVLDDRSQRDLIDRAVAEWNAENTPTWGRLAPGDDSTYDAAWEENWRRIAAGLARTSIAAAKNRRLDAERLLVTLADIRRSGGQAEELPGMLYLRIGAEIFARYQQLVETSAGIDFNDMVRLAVDLLEAHPDMAARLNERWPVVLEDEAQDSVPLQEDLLGRLTTAHGHWIRVGDPNQSITSTFTSADPRFLRRFLDREDVTALEMQVSGRCAPPVMNLANDLVDWVCTAYPVVEVRTSAFRRQHMTPTEAGDPQQNPAAERSGIALRGYEHRDEELMAVAGRARRFAESQPESTLAVLVPTNRLGYELADVLRAQQIPFDERLQSSRSSRTVVDQLVAILAFVADPLSSRALAGAFGATTEPPGDPQPSPNDDLGPLVRSCYRSESLLYPGPGVALTDAFPPVQALRDADLTPLANLAVRARRWLAAAPFTVDQLVLAIADDLYEGEDLARAHRVAQFLRRRADQNPAWRLPELAADLKRADAAREVLGGEEDAAFEPRPGQLTVTTMHKAKGMEWDLVYLVSIDGLEFPGTTQDYFRGHQEHLGGDPADLARTQLNALFDPAPAGDAGAAVVAATARAGQVEYIGERLRLLYVAITRARRYLAISFSQHVSAGQRTRHVPDAMVFHRLRTLLETRQEQG